MTYRPIVDVRGAERLGDLDPDLGLGLPDGEDGEVPDALETPGDGELGREGDEGGGERDGEDDRGGDCDTAEEQGGGEDAGDAVAAAAAVLRHDVVLKPAVMSADRPDHVGRSSPTAGVPAADWTAPSAPPAPCGPSTISDHPFQFDPQLDVRTPM